MPTLAATLKTEIRRLAGKEVKKALRSLRRIQRQMKVLRVAARGQKRAVAGMAQKLRRLKARVASRRFAAAMTFPTGRRGPRMSPDSIKSLRSRLKMTRLQFSKLLGVSPGSIFGWEKGRTTPRGGSLARVIEVRKMGVKAARRRVGSRTKRGAR